MRLARASWLTVLVVIIITAAVPALRQQVPLGLRRAVPGSARLEDLDAFLRATMQPYRKRAPAFVEEHYPNDAEMLLAAGIVADDTGLLKRAAEAANTPVAWAAYGEFLMRDAPGFERVASSGVDPANAEAVAQERKRIAESGYPDRLHPQQVAAILAALRGWQKADPENALPVALETRILYGLHRDRDALATWSRAGSLPLVASHAIDRAKPVERLLVAMGMPHPEALLNSQLSLIFPSFSSLRDTARIAVYEGRLAAMHGDPTAAVTWWESTADLGRHMQESADMIIAALVGAAIQGMGGHPVWQWTPSDDQNGIPAGPLLGGRYFWGDHHALYLTHMGEANDRALLHALILSKLRSQASRGYTTSSDNFFEAYLNATRFLALGAWTLVLSLILFLIFLAVRVSSGRTPARSPAGWRGHVLRLLPIAIALCVLLFLALNVYAASLRSAWYAQWSAPGVTEMTDMLQTLGDAWTNPTIPPDAYRAQYPPSTPG